MRGGSTDFQRKCSHSLQIRGYLHQANRQAPHFKGTYVRHKNCLYIEKNVRVAATTVCPRSARNPRQVPMQDSGPLDGRTQQAGWNNYLPSDAGTTQEASDWPLQKDRPQRSFCCLQVTKGRRRHARRLTCACRAGSSQGNIGLIQWLRLMRYRSLIANRVLNCPTDSVPGKNTFGTM